MIACLNLPTEVNARFLLKGKPSEADVLLLVSGGSAELKNINCNKNIDTFTEWLQEKGVDFEDSDERRFLATR